jgi:hypothetical protein
VSVANEDDLPGGGVVVVVVGAAVVVVVVVVATKQDKTEHFLENRFLDSSANSIVLVNSHTTVRVERNNKQWT